MSGLDRQKYVLNRSTNELKLVRLLCLLAFEPYGNELVISAYLCPMHFDWPISLNVELAVPYWQCLSSSVIRTSARLSLPRGEGTGVRPRGNGDLSRPSKASRRGTYFILSSLRLREMRPEKAVLSARPDAFGAARGVKRVDPRLHSGTIKHFLTPAISNQSPSKSQKPIATHINHFPWILTSIGLDSIGLTLTRATLACSMPHPAASRPLSTKAIIR